MSDPETFSLLDVAAMVTPAELAAICSDMIACARSVLDGGDDLSEGVAADMESDLARIRDDLDVPEQLKSYACELLARMRNAN